MFSHVTLGTNDLARATRFYDVALAAIGILPRFYDEEAGWAGYQAAGAARPLFIVMRPFDGKGGTGGNGAMVAFMATSRAGVDAFHAAALKAGGTDDGAPGLRPQYHADYYGAYVRDPDGNKLCCACHAPP